MVRIARRQYMFFMKVNEEVEGIACWR